jgi:two-component system chemotaxis sensor kinase CheA
LISLAPPEVAATLTDALSEVGRTTRVVQEHVFALRMVPIETGLRRLPRLIRYLSDSLGKPLRLDLTGGEVELDKRLVEQIVDPLTHIIRNAADHGIEAPSERIAAGKPVEGVIRLAVKQEGQNVVLTLSDDGKGLDVDRIRRKAVDRKLVRKDEELTESQALDLIFRPGFSTAEVVTDLSGRGVGLDVVRRNVDAMGGAIAVSSKRGEGCEFRFTLPLTTAVLDGLAIEIGDAVAIAPLLSVVESLRPASERIRTMAGCHEMLLLRGHAAPMVRLDRVFELPAKSPCPTEGIAIVVEHDGRYAALTADRLAGQVQVVLKSLEANYRRIDGIAGAAILGDGRVAFVLDVPALVSRAARGD